MRSALICASVLLVARTALAHDYWIEPTVVGTQVDARLFVGEAPVAESERPFEAAKLSRFEQWSRNGRTDLRAGRPEGALPFASVTGLGVGEFLFAVDRNPAHIELPPDKFEAYLTSEGLDAIVKERATRGESRVPGRERYTRYLKALVRVGNPPDHGQGLRVLGQRLEMLIDTAAMRAGTPFVVHVMFDGKPLVGAHVQASLRHDGAPLESAGTTNAGGAVTLTVSEPGFLVVHLVHMRRCACSDAEWESFWGSFSLVLSAPTDTARGP